MNADYGDEDYGTQGYGSKDAYDDSSSYIVLIAILILIVLFMSILAYGAFVFADMIKAMGG